MMSVLIESKVGSKFTGKIVGGWDWLRLLFVYIWWIKGMGVIDLLIYFIL